MSSGDTMRDILGSIYMDYCYKCHNNTPHKLIAYNKANNPVYECLSCGNFSVDEVNEEPEGL